MDSYILYLKYIHNMITYKLYVCIFKIPFIKKMYKLSLKPFLITSSSKYTSNFLVHGTYVQIN